MFTLYGTLTSPYVRRVRALAEELGVGFELVDVFTDSGQARLRERNPIWKVPSADFDGQLVFDSHVILDHLLAKHGAGAECLAQTRPPAPAA